MTNHESSQKFLILLKNSQLPAEKSNSNINLSGSNMPMHRLNHIQDILTRFTNIKTIQFEKS
jgi:hypothetical protein